jgi:FMN phosphatase YigB (HAD superfamily)
LNRILLTDFQIEDGIRGIKKTHDTIIESYGTQPDVKHLFAEMAIHFGIMPQHLQEFYERYQAGFVEHHPSLYDEHTLPVLTKLRHEGHVLAISSNTLFIDDESMLEALQKLGLHDLIDLVSDTKFSCAWGYSKPSACMFFDNTDWHVGDNVRTDGGCVQHGIKFFHINGSSYKTILDFYEHISRVPVCTED